MWLESRPGLVILTSLYYKLIDNNHKFFLKYIQLFNFVSAVLVIQQFINTNTYSNSLLAGSRMVNMPVERRLHTWATNLEATLVLTPLSQQGYKTFL